MRYIRMPMLAWLAVSAYALTPMPVEELARITQTSAAGRSDDKIARALTSVELSERLTGETLARLLRGAPGPRTRNALRALAVESSYLDPPAAELPPQNRPAFDQQRAMLARAVHYAAQYLHSLPDFLCTIETRLSDDDNVRPDRPEKWERFRERDVTVSALTFEHGRESYAVQTINGKRPRDTKPIPGLSIWGEFGPQVASLLIENSDATFLWSHWETLEGQRAAVFKYGVDAAHSSYTVSWSGGSTHAAYIGQLFVDPDSGALLRLTRQASDLPIESHIDRIQTVVDYRPVEIGGNVYVCPFRSVSVWRETRSTFHYMRGFLPQTTVFLNEVYFTAYRKFEAQSRILAESPAPDAQPTSPASVTLAAPPLPEATSAPGSAPAPVSAPQADAPASARSSDQPATFGTTVVVPGGLRGAIYDISSRTHRLPKFRKMKPVGVIYTETLNLPVRDFREGFPGVTTRFEWFAIDYSGRFWIEKPGEYEFKLQSDDGSILYIDDRVVVDNDGIHPPKTKTGTVTLNGGIHTIRVSYFQGPRFRVALVLSVKSPGQRDWQPFSTDKFSPPRNPEAWKYK